MVASSELSSEEPVPEPVETTVPAPSLSAWALTPVTSNEADTVTTSPDAALPDNVIVWDPGSMPAGTTKEPAIDPVSSTVS